MHKAKRVVDTIGGPVMSASGEEMSSVGWLCENVERQLTLLEYFEIDRSCEACVTAERVLQEAGFAIAQSHKGWPGWIEVLQESRLVPSSSSPFYQIDDM